LWNLGFERDSSLMNSKTISLVAVFAALTVALNIFSPIRIPAPYAPFLIYQIWEIPIVASFLLFGPLIGVGVTIINTLMLFAVFPGALPTGPLYNLAAVLGMLLGAFVALLIVRRIRVLRSEVGMAVCVTGFGVVFRTVLMTFVNWVFLPFPPPVGYSMPEAAVLASLPLVAFFNFTLALYTLPLGHFLAKVAELSTKIVAWSRGFTERGSGSS
jgi:riboflavin transporter FmnP